MFNKNNCSDKLLNNMYDDLKIRNHLLKVVDDNIYDVEAARDILRSNLNKHGFQRNMTPLIKRKDTYDELVDDDTSFKSDHDFKGSNLV